MIEKEKLKSLASSLLFDMEDNEYETLQKEFEVILKQMDIIDKIEGIENVEPMTFPFSTTFELKDNETDMISKEEAFNNAKSIKSGKIEVPRVVN